MCGINGIVFSRDSGREVSPDVLIGMRDIMRHRGPDDGGIFVDKNVGIGHRRLAIVDPRLGIQPMFTDDRSCSIVYNGEVYDHADHRAELESSGHSFHSRSDTETILHLYQEHGRDCVEYLRGMFAFAIWDAKRQELLIARDRLGVKPLYYVHSQDGSLYFASEIKSLLAAGAVKPEINFNALPDQLAAHGTSRDETLYAGIKRLMPGHTMVWKDGRIDIREYWDLNFEPKLEPRSDVEFVDAWREMFRKSVELRLMSDVPLGMFLSGGIDSSAIAAMMSTMVSEPIKTFSVGFREREANELGFARLVADAFGTEHHEITITPKQFFDQLPDLVWHEDEPIGFIASVPLYFVSKLAQEHVKVVLTGEGSDETLAGYGRYAKTLQLLNYGRKYESLTPGFVRNAVRGGVGTLPGGIGNKLSRTFLTRSADIENLFLDNFGVFPRAMQSELFSKAVRERIIDVDPYLQSRKWLVKTDAIDPLDQLLYIDTKTYLHELLMKQDQMSMAASIESRVPFLDHKLVEFAARMPREMKLRGNTTKWILREAMKGILPAEILDRPKMGFPVPVGNWFRGEFKHIVEEYVLSPRTIERGIFDERFVRALVARHQAGENHDERIWALVNFEIWQRRFFDGLGNAG
ncbi:MAG TPA: asparagine synthase (glutamine-hydrolyzing) [Pyrinomonadaceae bacterium]|nr:asparagine synthase (glutamine-hydrolyzing) [Chloracidobacterium sp.]MBP9935615.1 asparagine synthase (glutamine-hydrolyzing) [Pyrinomonadaceae bacterium]MBK7802287.1 asparagine synthase (glutamine-hydrolyzing) [Chloracidobacterium sp.]MBL0239831.1 asparagine synthase (glutamine-hydrolyzing) [Chloracidobacterium sp.]HQX56375.1 asparagine synthase (glutamine-hydrolyzing) [Pyrinomonadaceae bacterium]